MLNQLVGRKKELAVLKNAYGSNEAEFIAIYGRRRVGKTFLIRSFLSGLDCISFQMSGIHKATLKEQLAEFTKELERLYEKLGIKVSLKPPESWLDAFEALTSAIGHANEKIVIFFDEFPWMATKKSKLLQALDYYWNRYWSENSSLKLIICGSAASWIIENILNNKGGLHNRVTMRLLIEEFNLSETKLFLKHRGIILENYQILQLYMCIGGIPFYLKFLKKGLSAVQNINMLCFEKNGPLVDEFDNLFSSLFNKSDDHESIVKLLAAHRHGVSRVDITKALSLSGGALTRVLRELECAGFIESFVPWKKKSGSYYKLIDEYSLFYLNWIVGANGIGKQLSKNFWQVESQTSKWKAWSGYAFEAICFKHLSQLKNALNIPDGATAAAWNYAGTKKSPVKGAQVDLLFDRNDGIVNLCEIKYANDMFCVDKKYALCLSTKIESYKKVTKTKKQIVMSMITTYGLKKSSHLAGLVWSDASADKLFIE